MRTSKRRNTAFDIDQFDGSVIRGASGRFLFICFLFHPELVSRPDCRSISGFDHLHPLKSPSETPPPGSGWRSFLFYPVFVSQHAHCPGFESPARLLGNRSTLFGVHFGVLLSLEIATLANLRVALSSMIPLYIFFRYPYRYTLVMKLVF
jgi:hypothetical protein